MSSRVKNCRTIFLSLQTAKRKVVQNKQCNNNNNNTNYTLLISNQQIIRHRKVSYSSMRFVATTCIYLMYERLVFIISMKRKILFLYIESHRWCMWWRIVLEHLNPYILKNMCVTIIKTNHSFIISWMEKDSKIRARNIL